MVRRLFLVVEKGEGVGCILLVRQAMVNNPVGKQDEVGGEGEGPCSRYGEQLGDGDAEANFGAHVGGTSLYTTNKKVD